MVAIANPISSIDGSDGIVLPLDTLAALGPGPGLGPDLNAIDRMVIPVVQSLN